jgi:hypothetical protein
VESLGKPGLFSLSQAVNVGLGMMRVTLLVYLVAVMLLCWQPWNFIFIACAVIGRTVTTCRA